ncbi:MAG: hypothetical protein NC936_04870 [Candidatus Omnitrophica bacterium]|nr:hypothetical protein [Candidatus Omnitrophota bacterium]MCM8771181.1 hypothetical protein [Candidatus Omnitrophota bacterium]
MAKVGSFRLIWGLPPEVFCKKHSRDPDILLAEMRPHLFGSRYLTRRFKRATLVSDNTLGFLFFKKLIKEVILFYEKKDNFGYTLIPGSLTVIILAKRHQVPIRLVNGVSQIKIIKRTDQSALTFLGRPVTLKNILPILPEPEFADYKFLENPF